MRLGRLAWMLGACSLVAGCGARTSEDDLLGYGISGGPSVGGEGSGGFSVGGASNGGSFTGGAPFVGGSAGGPSGGCCVASNEPDCEDSSIYQCVCSFDPFCCDQAWDSTCVDEATTQCSLGCGGAPAGGAGGSGGAPGGAGGSSGGGFGVGGSGGTLGGDCCAPHGGVGCGVPPIMECVCDVDPYCCSTSWDQICANESVDVCGASCMGGGGSGGNGSGGNATGGSGVGGQSSGGTAGAGGQGTGGGNAGQCDVVFPDACSNCMCTDCFEPLDACLDDFGCLAIYSCVYRTGCTGTQCLSPDTCGNTFNAFGGVTGPSAQTALGLLACAVVQNCPCD